MDHQLTRLDSGVTVVTEHVPSVRSVSVGMWIGVGSRDEAADEAGCSHFLEHLLFKGTSTRSARDIAEQVDAVGGDMNAFTSKELTCFYARVLDRDLPVGMEVLADMMVDASNAPDDVEAERQVVLSEIDVHLDTPDELVHSDLAEVVFGTHPLALETLGTADSIAGMDRETVHAYYREHYRPECLVVAAAGNVDHDRLVSLADGLLGDLGRPGGSPPARRAPEQYGSLVRVRQRPTEQVHLAVGGPGLHHTHEDRWALRVFNTLLGGGMSSRLFQEIRERRGLAYSTYSFASSFVDGGLVGSYVGTSPGKVDEVLALLRHELGRVADDVTDAEVQRAKGALEGSTVLALEDTGSRMTRIGRQVATGAPVIGVDEALARIGEVDRSAVSRVARDVLGADQAVAVVGPFSQQEAERFGDWDR